MKWFDWVSIYWHSQLLHVGFMGVLTGQWLGAIIGYSGWITWKWYEQWRSNNDDLSGLFG
jgi:hypothetical protein